MPAKHFYFSCGALLGTAVVVAVRVNRKVLFKKFSWFRMLYHFDRDWFLYFPVVIGLFGLIGLVPDILHATGLLSKATTRSDFFNLFFFHSWFEHVEDLPEFQQLDRLLNWAGELFLLALAVGVILFYIRLAKQIIEGKDHS